MFRQAEYRTGLVVLSALSVLGWVFVIWSTSNMSDPIVKLMMPMTSVWSPLEVLLVWIMWSVMMGAMMLPSAAPMILTHRRFAIRKAAVEENRWFTFAYLLAWFGFSVLATGLQWGLQSAGVVSHMLVLKSKGLAALFLIAAGLMQWSPLKRVCLEKCRTPMPRRHPPRASLPSGDGGGHAIAQDRARAAGSSNVTHGVVAHAIGAGGAPGSGLRSAAEPYPQEEIPCTF